MPIYARSSGGNYKPAPAGTHPALCVDVVDLGMLKITWGNKDKEQHKVKIVWTIDELRDDGKQHNVSKRYTLSLHEKAALRKDLENWRGRAFTDEELKGFDLEQLLGVPALLNVIHAAKDGSTYANVSAIMKLPKGMQAPSADGYVRVCDRQAEDGKASEPSDWDAPPPSDDDVPF